MRFEFNDQNAQACSNFRAKLIWDFGPQSYDEKKSAVYVDASWAIEKREQKHE